MANTPTVEPLTVSVPTSARMLGISSHLGFELARRARASRRDQAPGGRTVVSRRELDRALRGGRDEAA